MKVIVLLSSYNGEKYIREQLDSLLAQQLQPYRIIIRDDGSSDGTIKILEEYSTKYKHISYYTGENLKPAKSFWNLIEKTEEADYYALCDQDDVWFPDKLSRAVDLLKQEDNSKPLLYCSRYILTDKDLNPLNSNVSSLYNFSDFPHALIYHTAPGCTFVFNEAARKQILRYDVNKEYCLIHDAIIHKVVTLYGKMILDPEAHMYYRQHGDNEIGMDANPFRTFWRRIDRFLNGQIRNYRRNTARSLLKVYGEDCDKDKRELIRTVAYYDTDKKLKKTLLTSNCYRSGTINDVFFCLLVLVNYI